MPETKPAKKPSWRFTSLKNLRAAPRSFLHHPEPRAIGSFVRGEQLLAGQFIFAGRLVEGADSSIWNVRPPSMAFLEATQSFSWLEDLAAIGDGAARKQAQKWLLEWIESFGQGSKIGWSPGLAGKRVIHWCSHAMFLLKGLSPKQSNAVFKSLGRQVNFLSNNWKSMPEGLEKFTALTGMIYAGLSLEGCEYALRPALKGLAASCHAWIGEDGRIPTRSPETLAEVFTLLTWVAKLQAATGHAADPAIADALERIAPGLRALRFGDGGLARFHGGGRGVEGQLDQSLADAGLRASTTRSQFMGYERLSAGRITVIMDAAASPDAHCSPLGFEMASGRWPMLVNCGPGARQGGLWANACAQAAAHNALTLEGESPARAKVQVERAQDLESIWLSAQHEGFAKGFGLTHERRLLVATNGQQFSGEDRLFPQVPVDEDPHPADVLSSPIRGHSYMLHFHLHPEVEAVKDEHGIALTLPNADVWNFKQEGGLTCLLDSIYLDRTHTAPRATKQIVVMARTLDYVGAIRWRFTKT
ncbi:MAG: heparinase II/III family protein [Rhodobacteraceae bacterium]|nr:heparinase II/III family protein [Paracoccaceae bacterium]